MMRKSLFIIALVYSCLLCAADFVPESRWITASDGNVDAENTWIAFRKDITLGSIPMKVEASIAADSKYWLWINGGHLHRGSSQAPKH